MAFNNRNNLSNESAPWGREVEQKIESNTYNLNQLRLLTENNNKATNGTLSALTRQQAALEDQQQTLEDQQQTLVEQQQTLVEQQQTLADQQMQSAQQQQTLADQQTELQTTQQTLADQQQALAEQQTQLVQQQQITSTLTNAWTIATYSGDFSLVNVEDGFGYKTVVLGTFLVSSPSDDFLTRFCSLSTGAWATISNYAGNFNRDIQLDLYLTVQGYGNVESIVRNTASFYYDNSPSTSNSYGTVPVYGFDRRRASMLGGHAPYNLLVLKADVFRPMTGGTFTISGNYELTVETSPETSTETISPV